MNRLYEIKFTKSSFDLDKDYERLSEHEKVDVAAMTPDSFLTSMTMKVYTDCILYFHIFRLRDTQKYLITILLIILFQIFLNQS